MVQQDKAMQNNVKTAPRKAAHTIYLGEDRKEKIERFRANRRLVGQPIPTIHDAVLVLIDLGLEHETLNQ